MTDVPASADPLGEALQFLRMSGIFYCRSELTAPFALALPPMENCLMLHVVTSGRCWLEVDGAEPRELRPGDLALVPHGDGHRLANEPGSRVRAANLFDVPREQLSDRYEILRLGGRGDATSMICAAVRFDHPAARHLVALLPRAVTIDAGTATQWEWIESTLRFMGTEARELRPGSESVITRLADVLVMQAIRSWIEQDPSSRVGWLGALQDEQIGRAMAAMHRDPARRWTVATLANEAGMSRSAFAARFTRLAGEPAMRYLTRWRMYAAATLLERDDAGVADVAMRLGYRSEAAFSRAFKRFVGTSPAARRITRGAQSAR